MCVDIDRTENMYFATRAHCVWSVTGGHVECLEAGVFRADLPAKFRVVPTAVQGLIDRVDADLAFVIQNENHCALADVLNYAEVRADVVSKLEQLRDRPVREECPAIYHLGTPITLLPLNTYPSPLIIEECVCLNLYTTVI
jgi:DNA polymerase epsilon subunit 1